MPAFSRLPFVTRRTLLAAVVIGAALAAGLTPSSRVAAFERETLQPDQREAAAPHAGRPRRRTACRRRPSRSPRSFGLPITNSMVVTWIVALGLIVFAQLATRHMTQVPGRAELPRVAGGKPLRPAREHHRPHLVERTFWFFGTIFIFILAANWIGLVPGVGTIGWGHQTDHGFVDRSAAVPRRQRRSQPDAGDGAGVLRLLDRVGVPGSRRRAA